MRTVGEEFGCEVFEAGWLLVDGANCMKFFEGEDRMEGKSLCSSHAYCFHFCTCFCEVSGHCEGSMFVIRY